MYICFKHTVILTNPIYSFITKILTTESWNYPALLSIAYQAQSLRHQTSYAPIGFESTEKSVTLSDAHLTTDWLLKSL